MFDHVLGAGKGEDAIIAVIDTGIAPSALDAFGGEHRVVSGVDLVSDVAMSMDGDGRDLDPTDPGTAHPVDCPGEDSWHGTAVASVSGGAYIGFLGVAPRAGIMHVRALGKCGEGSASDIADGIVFAAGGRLEGIYLPSYDDVRCVLYLPMPSNTYKYD